MAIAWSELPFVLAISSAGSLTGAARSLGINHSTAFRKLRLLEERLGVPLFDRLPGGIYAPTDIGEKFCRLAGRVGEEIDALEGHVLGKDKRFTGALRVTTSESIAHRLLLPHLRAFQDLHPLIDIQLDVSNRQLDLARREADIAIRTVRPAAGALWGRKVANIAWAIYSNGRGVRAKTAANPSFIGWNMQDSPVRVARWIEKRSGKQRIGFRTSSLVQQLHAARAGFGLAVLPCYLGDPEPGLVRVRDEPIPELRDELWIVAHEQLRKTARVSAFLNFIAPALGKDAALIAGRRAQG